MHGGIMKKFKVIAITVVSFLLLVGNAKSQESLKVDTKGVTAKILYEVAIDGGHIADLKGNTSSG